MQAYETRKQTTWECKYRAVFIPQYRKRHCTDRRDGIGGKIAAAEKE